MAKTVLQFGLSLSKQVKHFPQAPTSGSRGIKRGHTVARRLGIDVNKGYGRNSLVCSLWLLHYYIKHNYAAYRL